MMTLVFVFLMKCLLSFFDQDVMFSSPIGFVGSSIDIVDYAEDVLRRYSSLEDLLFEKSPDCDSAASFCFILMEKLLSCQSDTPDFLMIL